MSLITHTLQNELDLLETTDVTGHNIYFPNKKLRKYHKNVNSKALHCFNCLPPLDKMSMLYTTSTWQFHRF